MADRLQQLIQPMKKIQTPHQSVLINIHEVLKHKFVSSPSAFKMNCISYQTKTKLCVCTITSNHLTSPYYCFHAEMCIDEVNKKTKLHSVDRS